jgi:hypothetical protein
MTIKKLAVIPAILAVSACGGGGGTSVSGGNDGANTSDRAKISNVNTIATINDPDSIISYNVNQNGTEYKGYVVTNEPEQWQNGVITTAALENIEVTDTLDFAPSSVYVGTVVYDGVNYKGFLYEDPNNKDIELIMAEHSENVNGGWNFEEDRPLPANTIIRAIGPSSAPIDIIGNAEFKGAIMMQGGDGRFIDEAVMNVNFDNSTGTFEVNNTGSPSKIYANLEINKADGTFSGDNVIVTFNSDIFDPKQGFGKLEGNFTGSDQNGAIGAIWSSSNEDQFQGAFALDKE